jgi:hypothetical protein
LKKKEEEEKEEMMMILIACHTCSYRFASSSAAWAMRKTEKQRVVGSMHHLYRPGGRIVCVIVHWSLSVSTENHMAKWKVLLSKEMKKPI